MKQSLFIRSIVLVAITFIPELLYVLIDFKDDMMLYRIIQFITFIPLILFIWNKAKQNNKQ